MDTLENVVVPIIVALLGSGLWAGIIDAIKTKRKKLTIEQKMLLGLAHDSLYSKLDYYLSRGYVTADELEDIEYLYVPYKMMGGNGTCERMYEQVNKLSHKKAKEN